MTRDQAMASGVESEVEKILTKFDDSDVLAWMEDGHDGIDEALFAISMEDMPYGTQKARTGDPTEWLYDRYYEEISAYAKDNFGAHLGEERDIEHANTPDERTAGVDMVTHGTSGGLNRPKAMHKPAAGGDNAMQRPMEDVYESELKDDDEDEDDEYPEASDTDDTEDYRDEFNEEVTDETFVNEHADVDNFLSMYKEFKIRTDKK